MRRLLITVFLILFVGGPVRGKSEKQSVPQKADDLFGMNRVWTIEMRVSQESWRLMQPISPGRQKSKLDEFLDALKRPTTGPTTSPTTRPQPIVSKPVRPNGFGLSYSYVPATITIDGQVIENAGLRFKGNSSYTSVQGTHALRKPYKIDFERFISGQKFCGLGTLNLHNNAFDTTQMREALSYYVYRQAGVPAPRTAWALVYATVDGLHNREYLGLYLIVEEVDRHFLRKRFGDDGGLLLKPEGARGLPHLGDNWNAYDRTLRPHTTPTTRTSQRYIEFTKLIHKADDKEFQARIGEFIDVDEFLKFIAATVLISNMDSILVTDHNFLMYVDPKDGRIRWIPWDLNLSFGAFIMLGDSKQQTQLSIDEPFIRPSRLLERIMADPQMKRRYREHIRQMTQGAFQPKKLAERAREIERKVITRSGEAAKAAGKAGNPSTRPAAVFWASGAMDVPSFAAARVQSVVDQLNGGKGYEPMRQRPNAPRPVTRPALATTRSARPIAVNPTTRPVAVREIAPTTRPPAIANPARVDVRRPARERTRLDDFVDGIRNAKLRQPPQNGGRTPTSRPAR